MKIALVNRLDNRFTPTLSEGLRAAGHDLVVVAPDGPIEVPAGRIEEAVEGTDLVLSCWADAVTSRLSRRRDIRLVTFVRGDEVMTPEALGEIDWRNVSGAIFVAPHVRDYAAERFPFLREIWAS